MISAGISKWSKLPAAALAATATFSLVVTFFSGSFSPFTYLSHPKLSKKIPLETLIRCELPAFICRRKNRLLSLRVKELEASLEASLEMAASERRGRVRAQQALRIALTQQSSDGSTTSRSESAASYPMAPIGFVQSCFATRNGTPRQPLLVPLSRACLLFDSSRVPAAALDGLGEYSHCWVLYVFHLNTDLEKLWKQTSRSKFKAKVRVPRLEGGKMGVLATRSPHRPCPIGLSVAKIEALEGNALLLSGIDLVDGTPVLDVKPYLPYSDNVQGATIPKWLKEENALAVSSISFSAEFNSTLSICWLKNSFIKEVLSWDIRSFSQRSRPHHGIIECENHGFSFLSENGGDEPPGVIYHLILEGVDISYRIDDRSNILVERATLLSGVSAASKDHYSYSTWRHKLVKN
ncbi:uncharacterized protein LOC110023482 isoform X2 [Phalaenopsis equestris]|uniref:uncharacterized protein LOC110023482 isoform X2 n=1 Tax=Phalaenopsis equestris TaxID=78828 RepID=UPI0009E4837F|nr:uncharacterized protein LOC110023482 isoform X2 [Phalaenopsis equestris]